MDYLLVVLLTAAAVAALESLVGTLRIGLLRNERPIDPSAAPRLSVVVAARNEAEHIEHALSSVLAQDYPRLEVVVVDDRSEDETGPILDRMAKAHAALRVHHVTALPDGWLGKNHALATGAGNATGDWLLFTDADVVFAPGALRRGVGAAVERQLDMLAVTPSITSPSWAVRAFVAGFALFFGQFARPWRVKDPHSRASLGIGAFNLVRSSSYRRAGGHAPLRMRPDDDLMLGRLIKQSGGSCDVQFGIGAIGVAWYATLQALVHGLMKNSFAGVGYSLVRAIAAIVALVAVGTGPLTIAVVASGPVQPFAVGVCALQLASAVVATRSAGLFPAFGVALPVSSVVFSYILARATITTVRNRGITWRGTFYPLDELRKNRL